jgi:hypothetical protein
VTVLRSPSVTPWDATNAIAAVDAVK